MDKNATIQEAKDYLKRHWKEGCSCPVCNQDVKRYERKLSYSMVRVLFILRSLQPTWIMVTDYLRKHHTNEHLGNQFSLLRHWGLLEKWDGVRDDGSNRTGYWRVTQKGREFVDGQISVMSHAAIYNDHFYGFEGDPVRIMDIKGKAGKFNFAELMRGFS